MKIPSTLSKHIVTLFAGLAPILAGTPVFAQLYSQNFDVDDSANWTVNNGPGDEAHDFFFDYSSVGIPSAPNSGGTTRGMKLQANLIQPDVGPAAFTGMSVSPTDKSFTGDYTVKFDVWSNYLGNSANGINNIAATTGSSMLSEFGVLTAGTAAQWPGGVTDSVWFGALSDTSSTAYRIYSTDRPISYRATVDTDDMVTPANNYTVGLDDQANYLAMDTNGKTTRSNNPNSTVRPPGQLYLTTFPGVTVPTTQTNADPAPGNPSVDLTLTQFGTSPDGVFGFKWHQVEIAKVGTKVTWKVDGTELANVETANFTKPTGGDNIFFGHSDINTSNSTDPNFPFVQFTLVDNVRVEAVAEPVDDADFNDDGAVDGKDFLTWQVNNGITGEDLGDGDADGDSDVDADDLAVWQTQFGTASAVAAAGVVPEPASWCSAVVAALALAVIAAPRRRAALQTVVR